MRLGSGLVIRLGAVPVVHVVGRVVGAAVAEDVYAVSPDVCAHVGPDVCTIPTLPSAGGLVDHACRVRGVPSRVLADQVHVDTCAGTGADGAPYQHSADNRDCHHGGGQYSLQLFHCSSSRLCSDASLCI